jgi:serine/threonine protein kinase
MSDEDQYEDDFYENDEKVRDEFDAANEFTGPIRSPSPDRSGALRRSHKEEVATFLQARVSVIGTELTRALDSTIRPSTSGGVNKSMSFGTSADVTVPTVIVRPSSADGTNNAVRQSQDLFAALDLANTNAGLKESYTRYWDAVEEQFRAEQAAEEAMKARRTRNAEQKHLSRLKAKMAQKDQGNGIGNTVDSRTAKQEAGWDAGFVYEKQPPPVSLPAGTFLPPSVAKAQAALTNIQQMGSVTATFSSSSLPGTAGRPQQQQRVPGGSPQAARTQAFTSVGNVKVMPPAPSGVVDPSRVRSVVQTHMPSYILAKLARQRGCSAGAHRPGLGVTGPVRVTQARSRKGSAASQRPSLIRRATSLNTDGTNVTDAAAPYSEEISPTNDALRSATSTASGASSGPGSGSSSIRRQPRPGAASAKGIRPSAAGAASTSAGIPARAASAGSVKPTNATMLLAAERAAQLHAAVTQSPDTKTMPLVQYNRMRREIEDLRRKVVALTAENDALRAVADEAVSIPIVAASESAARASTISHARVGSVPVANVRPSISRPSSLSATTGASIRSSPPAALSKGAGLKLNLAGIRPDDHGNSVIPAQQSSVTNVASANSLLSPRSRCAVADCPFNRTGGKPYCSKHVEEQAQGTVAVSSSSQSATAIGSASNESSSVIPSALTGLGLKGMTFALGGASISKYSYDYESDDNYGGTDMDSDESFGSDSGDGEEDGDEEDREHSSTQHQSCNVPVESDLIEEEFSRNGGDTQRQIVPPGYGSHTARVGPTPRQKLSNTQMIPHVDRIKSDPTSATSQLSATAALEKQQPIYSNALYSARDRFHVPLRSSYTPRTLASSKPVDVRDAAGAPFGSSPPPIGNVFDLESLRASPYANLDALGGSFEITQSGTFKRGGFALNKQGMVSASPPHAQSHLHNWPGSGDITAREQQQQSTARARAFPWEVKAINSTATTSAGGFITPTSQHASATPSPAQALVRTASGSSSHSHASTPSSSSGNPLSSPTGNISPATGSSVSTPFFRPLAATDIYTLGVLGRGSSGVVYKSFYAPTVELLAVKAISIGEKDKRKQLTQELRTLTLSPNPHTIGFRGAYFDESHIYIAMEYMDGGSLDDLREKCGPLSEIELACIFEQAFKGLKHLHRQHIIHRDIKPHSQIHTNTSFALKWMALHRCNVLSHTNLFVTVRFRLFVLFSDILYNSKGAAKLTDFGIISDLKERNESAQVAEAKTFVGTLLYMGPERIGGATYSYPCDIWSMALALLSCRVGTFAIPHQSHWELVNAIQSGPAILNHYNSDQISDTLRDLLSHCLRTNPSERPTAAECLRHPFFSQFRINGAAMPIPLPPGFPPTSNMDSCDDPHLNANGPLSPRSDRRAKKAAEVEQRNERNMLEHVCKLMVQKGMTMGRPTTTTAVTAPDAPSPRIGGTVSRAPMDPKLCDRICDRLSTLLKVDISTVKPILIHMHNQYVGLP